MKLVLKLISFYEWVSLIFIGALISEDIFDVLNGNAEEFSQKKYRRKLEKITAKRWLKGQY